MHIMDYILMTFLFQYIPRVVHFVLFGWRLQRINGYIFGTATWGFVLNFAMYLCAAHVSIPTLATMFSSNFWLRQLRIVMQSICSSTLWSLGQMILLTWLHLFL